MTLTITKKGGAKETIVVPIVPPLKGYDDVKPRLLEMKAKAQEGLGMVRTPTHPIPTVLNSPFDRSKPPKSHPSTCPQKCSRPPF